MTRRRRVAAVVVAAALSLTGWSACESTAQPAAAGVHAGSAVGVAQTIALTPLSATAPPAVAAVVSAAGIDRYRRLALAAGWSAAAWPRVRCIIRRESGGDPHAFNRGDGHGGSRGLMQINGVHTKWLIRKGIIRSVDDLFDPAANLRAARAVWKLQGWHAWTSRRHPC